MQMINLKSQNAMQLYRSCGRHSAQLVNDLRVDEHDGLDGVISIKGEALEADLFHESTHEEVKELDKLKS